MNMMLIYVIEQKVFVHSVLAEPNTKHRELQWKKKLATVSMNGIIQENRQLMLKILNSLMLCRLQII